MKTISEETILVPSILADVVAAEAERIANKPLPELPGHLAQRAERAYQAHPSWRKKAQRGRGDREFVLAFMRHWAAVWMLRNGRAQREDIPANFANGASAQ